MRTHNPQYARSEYHTQLAKTSFEKILDLTAGVCFHFHNIDVVALLTELLCQVIKYSSAGSAVAFLGQITLFEDRSPREKRIKFCI